MINLIKKNSKEAESNDWGMRERETEMREAKKKRKVKRNQIKESIKCCNLGRGRREGYQKHSCGIHEFRTKHPTSGSVECVGQWADLSGLTDGRPPLVLMETHREERETKKEEREREIEGYHCNVPLTSLVVF